MKRLLLAILSLFALNCSYAQNTFPWPNTGSIGIGTNTPSSPLHIYNSGYLPLLSLQSAANSGETQMAYLGTGSTFYTGLGGAGENYWNVANSWYIFDQSNNAMRFVIKPSGFVGVGTTTPQSLFEIRKDVSKGQGPILELTNGGSYEGASSEIYFSTYYRYGDATISPSARIKVVDNGDWGGDFYFETKGTDFYAPLTTRMYIDGSSGHVGVGTVEPDQALTVSGTVHATEVLVDQSVKTPDYVFDKDYDLVTLKDVKTYIDKNHHLPEIPSAAQVAKEGINLGEMNTKLLKKIEELTLYLIEKDGQVNQQREQNCTQQQQINLQQQEIDLLKIQMKSLTTHLNKE